MDAEKISEQKISRSAALKGTAGVVGAAALSRVQIGSDRLEAAATYVRPAAELSGSISIWAQGYNPTPTMTSTAQDPIPRHMLKVVITEYEKLHPKVTININMHRPTAQDRTWMITQLTGDIAPEIAWAQSFDTNQDIDKGWWVKLDPYLNGPNQYIPAGHPGHDRWIDEFYNSTTQAKRAPDGHMYVIPYDLVTTFFFYNKKLFAKAGIAAPPTTWTEFLE